MRSDRERVLDILEAIEKIEQQLPDDVETFAEDELRQIWVIHHLQIIGEAANGLSSQFRAIHPSIPWHKIIGMRHVLVHGYFAIDLEVVWTAVDKDLPLLKRGIEEILGELGE
jgi:uncharacterized protein with HEPN domain